jgi:adenosylhomocysteine nucleosidase
LSCGDWEFKKFLPTTSIFAQRVSKLCSRKDIRNSMPLDPAATPLPEANLPPCHVGVVFALALEAGSFEDRLAGKIAVRGSQFTAWQGGLNGRGVVVMHAGPGQLNAAAATTALILGHRPRWVISAGLAGGLHPSLKRGDVIMPDFILDEDGHRLAIDFRISHQQQSATPGLHVGPLLTIDHVAFKPAQKRQLGQRHGALAVDMETLAVAEICRREKQRFLAVRVISDAVDDELPADVEHLMTRNTLARKIGAAAGTFVRRPSTVKELWKLRETVLMCAKTLGGFLEGVVPQLRD